MKNFKYIATILFFTFNSQGSDEEYSCSSIINYADPEEYSIDPNVYVHIRDAMLLYRSKDVLLKQFSNWQVCMSNINNIPFFTATDIVNRKGEAPEDIIYGLKKSFKNLSILINPIVVVGGMKLCSDMYDKLIDGEYDLLGLPLLPPTTCSKVLNLHEKFGMLSSPQIINVGAEATPKLLEMIIRTNVLWDLSSDNEECEFFCRQLYRDVTDYANFIMHSAKNHLQSNTGAYSVINIFIKRKIMQNIRSIRQLFLASIRQHMYCHMLM